MKKTEKPKNDCKGCEARDRIIKSLAEKLDDMYESAKAIKENTRKVVRLLK